MPTVLITGANGALGQALAQAAARRYPLAGLGSADELAGLSACL